MLFFVLKVGIFLAKLFGKEQVQEVILINGTIFMTRFYFIQNLISLLGIDNTQIMINLIQTNFIVISKKEQVVALELVI